MHATLLPPGTRLYRGDTPLYRRGAPLGTSPFQAGRGTVFFTTEAKHAKQYGVVWEFTTTVPLHLVDLSEPANMQALYRHAQEHGDNDIVQILERDFGYKTGLRASETSANDSRVAEYIAALGDNYDGYMLSKSMKTAFGGSFHPEVALSKKQDTVVVEQMISSEREADAMMDEERERSHAQSLKAARKSRRRRDDSPIPSPEGMQSMGMGMGALAFDSPPSSPLGTPKKKTIPKLMYKTPGGRGSKRKRSKKSRKTRKST